MAYSTDWPQRAIITLRGNQTLPGCILLACLNKSASHAPRIVSAAEIRKDGQIIAAMQARGMAPDQSELLAIGSVDQLRDAFNRLSDILQFSDAERLELFDTLRQWVKKDWRATSGDWLAAGEGVA